MQSRIRGGPGLGQNGQPITAPWSELCHCSCHPPQKPPPAVEARLCRECADERFKSWQDLVEVMMCTKPLTIQDPTSTSARSQ